MAYVITHATEGSNVVVSTLLSMTAPNQGNTSTGLSPLLNQGAGLQILACIIYVWTLNPRRACAARVGSVCPVKSHLTYGASVRPENAVT